MLGELHSAVADFLWAPRLIPDTGTILLVRRERNGERFASAAGPRIIGVVVRTGLGTYRELRRFLVRVQAVLATGGFAKGAIREA